ncbi:MAG: UvrB/UvrC motif-containing protein [Planctomycetaceae bacterium]
MKKCRRCTKPATLHITEIKSGQARSLHLCENCAKDYLDSVTPGSSQDDETTALDEGFGDGDLEPDEQVCPECGMTFKKFRSQGRLGCAQDYVLFREKLVPLLESIHGERQHIGKCPAQQPQVTRRNQELARLKIELKAAIEAEDYEQAAQLRDAIREAEESSRD